jgi:ribosomal protein S12 methylthiotransferase accessory factor
MADSAARLRLLTERLAAEGLEPLVIDCSPQGSPVKAVKTIVPGLESETMSYHRIGWRGVRRLRGRGDPLLLDAPREGAARVRLRPEDEARAGGPAWFDARLADETVGRLYPLYRECGTFSAQLYRQRQAA